MDMSNPDPVDIKEIRLHFRQSPKTDLYYATPSSLPEGHPMKGLMVVAKEEEELFGGVIDAVRELFVVGFGISVSVKPRGAHVEPGRPAEYVYDIFDHGTYCPNAVGHEGEPGEHGEKGKDNAA